MFRKELSNFLSASSSSSASSWVKFFYSGEPNDDIKVVLSFTDSSEEPHGLGDGQESSNNEGSGARNGETVTWVILSVVGGETSINSFQVSFYFPLALSSLLRLFGCCRNRSSHVHRSIESIFARGGFVAQLPTACYPISTVSILKRFLRTYLPSSIRSRLNHRFFWFLA